MLARNATQVGPASPSKQASRGERLIELRLEYRGVQCGGDYQSHVSLGRFYEPSARATRSLVEIDSIARVGDVEMVRQEIRTTSRDQV